MVLSWLFGGRQRVAASADADDAPEGLVCAYLLDGSGRGRALDWAGVKAWTPADGPLWVHLNRRRAKAQHWLRDAAGLDEVVVEALLEDEARPRAIHHGTGIIVTLRGANANPGAAVEDLVALRAWLEPGRLVTTRARKAGAVDGLRAKIAAGGGPKDSTDCLLFIASAMMERITGAIAELDEDLGEVEETVLEGDAPGTASLLGIRRRALKLRRYMAPQRDAFVRLAGEPSALIDARDREILNEIANRTQRAVESIDHVRERAGVAQDEIANRRADRQGRHAYLLSLVATVFLPLSFVTSLFSVQLTGLPDHPLGFWYLCGALGVLVLVQVVIFRWARWL